MLEEGDYEGVMSQMGEKGGDVASILAPLQRDKAKVHPCNPYMTLWTCGESGHDEGRDLWSEHCK